jgi:hypothetical protein
VARKLTEAGYHVLGIDIYEVMIEMARGKMSGAGFRIGSLFDTEHRDWGLIRQFVAYTRRWFPAVPLSLMSQGRGGSRGEHD